MNDKEEDVQQSPVPDSAVRLRQLKADSPDTEFGFVLAAFDKARNLGPGNKNPIIYDDACSLITSLRGNAPASFGVAQSEFLDIEHERGPRLAKLAKQIFPVGPIPFSPEEFVDLNQFINAIAGPLDAAEEIISARVRKIAAELHGGSVDNALREARKYPANVASWINRCLADPVLFKEFARLKGFVLPPLVRPASGAFGVEIHELPDLLEYENKSLAPYQRACVNRAIFDAVFPTALRPGRYVNTQHVADKVPNVGPKAVVACFGFFPHSERVRRTVASTLWNRGIEIPAERIIECPVHGDWGPEGQQWCVSLEVFGAYSRRGAFR
jgi:hypothetical protein